jgi:alkaline phosphatase D
LLPMQFRLDGPGALRDAAPRLVETFAELGEDGLADIAPRGDMIYADNPIVAEVALPGGAIWRNVVIPEKAKVAETVAEFRGNYRYNLMDEHVRRFNAEVAQYVQWDDHEVTNNWFHERILDDARYTEKRVALLAARAKRAMFEFTPTRPHPVESERVYRVIHRGPLLDLFLLDMRSYRGPNGENRQPELTDEARVLGEPRRRGGSSGSCSARRPPGR